jgi:sugar-phosphatase
MLLFTCRAVLFDLDGVLVDSTPCVTRVWTAWALEHGLDPEYVVHVAHGKKAIETVRAVAPHLEADHEFAIIEQRELADTDGLRVLPGAKELLTSLPARKYAIVTSGTRRLAIKRLGVAGLPIAKHLITADEVTLGKPDPEPYLKGAAAIGVPATECLVFEDAPSGLRSAHAAGARAIGIVTTYRADEFAKADVMIPSLASVTVCGISEDGELQFEVEFPL